MKKVLAAMFAACTLLSIVSCGKKSKNDEITLTVWESTGGPDLFIQKAGELYSQTHPNVKIKYVNVELGDSVGQIALDGPAGKGPDLFAGSHDKLGSIVTGGHALPTVNSEGLSDRILSSCKSALTYDGVMYGYPVSAETYALFYNKAYVSQADVPSTWEDLEKWVLDFNKKNPGKFGFVMNAGEGYYTIIFTTSDGNRLFGESGTDRNNSNINSAASIKGMEFFKTLRRILDVPAADLDTASVDGAFQSGNAAMHITGLWNVANFKNAGIDFGVAPLPALPGDDKPSASFSGTRAMFVSAYTDYPEQANDFAQFLMSDEIQKLRFDITGALPSVNIDVESPYLKGFMTQLDYAFPMPSIPEMALYWEAMNNASKNIWNGADVKKELDACNASLIQK